MLFSSLFGLLLAGTAFGQSEQDKQPCAKGVHIIAARGNGTAQGYGIMLPMVVSIKHAIPHSTNISVTYPKLGTTQEGNTVGTAHQKRMIRAYAKRCPRTPIVLVGYSEGAGLTMNTLCGTTNVGFDHTVPLSKKFRRHILGAVVYGDYTRVSNQPYDMGGCKSSSMYARGNPKTCLPAAPKIRSYCNAQDPVCCSTGHNTRQHFTYFDKYDAEMSRWIKRLYKQHKHHKH